MAVVNQLPDTVGTTNKEAPTDAGENLQKLAQDPSQCRPSPTGASGLQGDQSTSTSTTTTEAVTHNHDHHHDNHDDGAAPGNSGNNQGGGPPNGTPPARATRAAAAGRR